MARNQYKLPKSQDTDEGEGTGEAEGIEGEGTGDEGDFPPVYASKTEAPDVGFRVENVGKGKLQIQLVSHDHTGILHARDVIQLAPGEGWEAHSPVDMLRVKRVE